MKINLGGVCKGKDWRNEFIEKINRQDIEFYNPLKKNGNGQRMKNRKNLRGLKLVTIWSIS